jgi:ABC-2 type transport system permease protein
MHVKNILHLGIKEFWSLGRDPMMIVLIVYAFTASIYSIARGLPDTLHKAPIAIVDEDQSPLSQRIVNAFLPPLFLPPKLASRSEMDSRMDAGLDTFALDIPPRFQEDVLAGRAPTIQLNTDATRVGQAFSGSSYVQTIVTSEVQTWLQRYRSSFQPLEHTVSSHVGKRSSRNRVRAGLRERPENSVCRYRQTRAQMFGAARYLREQRVLSDHQ